MLKERFAVVMSVAAVFIALGGTSYAAYTISGTNIKKGSIPADRLTKKAVVSLRGQRGARGLRGVAGPTGPTGPKGDTGTVDTSDFYDKAASDARFGPAQPVVFSLGAATTLPARTCQFVLGSGGALADGDAGKLVVGYIVDVNGNRIPSLNNATAFRPGTLFKTSQGGVIGFVEVCNLSDAGKNLPQGWRLVSKIVPV